MTDAKWWDSLKEIVQQDVGRRGLGQDPEHNLFNAFPNDLRDSCRSIATNPSPVVALVTGFFISQATPPAWETDGPLGALFLVQALPSLGAQTYLLVESSCGTALQIGLEALGLEKQTTIVALPNPGEAPETFLNNTWPAILTGNGPVPPPTHVIAIERVGPAYSGAFADRCYSMRGTDITDSMMAAYRLFEIVHDSYRHITTIGIGDGGNEIGMGKIPREIIKRNVPRGDLIACRVATHWLIVSGISNWGAYALATGVLRLRNAPIDSNLFNIQKEESLLKVMVENGPLVDGVLGTPSLSVDGIAMPECLLVLTRLSELLRER